MKKILSLVTLFVVAAVLVAHAFANLGSVFGGSPQSKAAAANQKVVEDNYAPNGASFEFPFALNWDTQKLVAELDLSTCGAYTENELIFTVGTSDADLSKWATPNGANMHIYYTKYTQKLVFHYLTSKNRVDHEMTGVSDDTEFVLDNEGFKVNGTLLATAVEMPELYATNSFLFGSKEGATRSKATYKSVEVQPLNDTPETPQEIVLAENVTPNGNFVYNSAINWDEQKIEASIDLTNCSNTIENVLAIGPKGLDWSTTMFVFWYKNEGAHQDYTPDGGDNTGKLSLSGEKTMTIELSKENGFVVNGKTIFAADNARLNSKIFSLSEIYIGSQTGNAQITHATYNYIKIVPLHEEQPKPEFPNPAEDAKTYKDKAYVEKENDEASDKVEATAYVSKVADKENTVDIQIDKFNVFGTEKKINVAGISTKEENGYTYYTAETAQLMTEDGDTYEASVSGISKGDKLFLEIGTDAEVLGVKAPAFVFGDEAFPGEAVVYTGNAKTTYANENFEYTDNKVEVTNLNNGYYKVVYKDYTLGSNRIADIVFDKVTAVAAADEESESVSLAFNGNATLENVNENIANTWKLNNGDNVKATMEGAIADSKLKANFGVELAGIQATTAFGEEQTPDQPKDEYAVNFDKSLKNNHASRRTNSISLLQTGGDEQTIDVNDNTDVYEDLSAQTFTVEAGSELTASFGYNGEWMHGYVYIDENNDKQFSWNADGEDQTGTELVAFSYYKGKDSTGDDADGSCGVNPPSFTAPTTPGTYRMRYKIDWDNVDPGGSVTAGNHIANNGGGIWDVTLKVVAPEEKPVETKTYTDKLELRAGMMSPESTTYENKTVVVNKYEDGTTAFTFKEFPISDDETLDLTFRGTLTDETIDGKDGFTSRNLTCTVDNEASSINGKELKMTISGWKKSDGTIYLQFTFKDSSIEVYKIGSFGSDVETGINGINAGIADGSANIYTVGGSKVNTLQNGVNIVRTADGKTVKVVVKK